MRIVFFALLVSLNAAAHDLPVKLYCEIETVSNCVGDVSFHCGAPGYKVTCQGSVKAQSWDDASKIKQKLEQGKFYVD